jgi:ADP-heptose:LPS heptosyltransferase
MKDKILDGKKLLIAPYSRMLLNGAKNPKNFPHWEEYVRLVKDAGAVVTQIGMSGEPTIGADFVLLDRPPAELKTLLDLCDVWLTVDTFFQHFAWHHGKPGIVVFSQSDPLIFGHKENLNILKSEKYLRNNQFNSWTEAIYDPESFVSADEVFRSTVEFVLQPGTSGIVYSEHKSLS